MLRSIALLVLVAACSGAPAAAPTTPPPVVLPSGPGAPWPPPTVVPAAGLRTADLPLPHDLAQLRRLQEITVSRDGTRVAYVVRMPRFDPAAKPAEGDSNGGWKVEQQLFLVRRGSPPLQLTFAAEPVSSPQFAPDGGRLAFVRPVGGKPAVQILDLAGGEARTVDLGKLVPLDFAWSPDGKAIAFTAERPAGDDDTAARWRRGGAVPWQRDWEQVHLFVADLAGGEPRHVNQGSDAVIGFRWSPDGRRFAVLTSRSTDPYETYNFRRLAVVSAGDGTVERVVEDQPRVIHDVAWSPDGRLLAYSTTSAGFSHIDELRVSAVDGNPPRNAAAGLDATLDQFVWAGDGRSLIATVVDHTRTALYRLPVDGRGAARIPTAGQVLRGLEADASGRTLVAAAATPTSPWDPVTIDAVTGKLQALDHLNPQVSAWSKPQLERVTWKNGEGTALDGLLWVTPHAAAGAKPPLLVMPHGGPDGVSMELFDTWAIFFAARGYSVFQPNYRGGIGYGRAFYEANRGRLGDIEFADIESGVDSLIAAGKADPGRLFYGSWSWGGYLSAWTLAHTTRYQAIMVGAGVVDTVVQYVGSDINHGVVADWEFKGRPWTQQDAFDRANPIRFMAAARTPTLIIHGMNDPRVPFVNGAILYRALSDLGVDVTMWAYPGEPHGFTQPAHVQHMLETWAAFFDAH